MATSSSGFFLGVASTIAVLAIGFGGGLMFAKTVMESPPARTHVVERAPPARVVLSTSAEAAMPAEEPIVPAPQLESANDNLQQTAEKDSNKQAERAERHNEQVQERERRKRVAERKAKREAARVAKQEVQEQQQQPQQSNVMSFNDNDEQSRLSGSFGN